MLGLTLISIVYFSNIFLLSSSIIIGKLSNKIYIPSSSIINLPILFYYSNNCEECLCYGIQSTTTFVVINCLTNIRLCLFYSSYVTDYSIQRNSSSYVYFFTLPPIITTIISSQITTDEPSIVPLTTISFFAGWNSTGITVAGITGSQGVAANQFQHPFCVALGPSNALYITDQPNQRVQKWVTNASTGITVAGSSNAATGNTLNYLSYPSDLAVDSSGNIYIVDGGNSRVVYWRNGASSGILVAGTGTAGSANNQLSNPVGLAFDSSSGTLYISDAGNHRIMQYLSGASSGILVAGGNGGGIGNTQLYNPRGLYFESSTNSLLIANNYAHNIVRWVLGASTWTLVTGSSSGLVGTTPTLLNYPTDVTLDSMGNMYISDEGNHRIQFFLAGQSSGITIAGVTGTSGSTSQLLYTPSSLTLDSQLNIYVTDYNNYRVQKFLHY